MENNKSRKQIDRPKFLPGLGRPVGLSPETDFRGNTGRWVYRIGHGKRIPMRDANGRWLEWGSPAFCELYRKLHLGGTAPAAPIAKAVGRADESSLGWLIGQFRASKRWPTRKHTATNYNSVLNRIEARHGGEPFRGITSKTIATTRDTIADIGWNEKKMEPSPTMANKFVSVMRVLFAWAASKEAGALVDVNPAVGVSNVEVDTEHHTMWTDDHRKQFTTYWPRGSQQHLAYALLYGSGQRRSDVVLMGPRHLTKDGEVMSLVQVKTATPVSIPMESEWMNLKAEIAAAKVIGAETFIVGQNGQSRSPDDFGRWFGAAAKEAGLDGLTAHGLRRSASAAAVEAGYTGGQMQTQFGYTLQQAEDYIKEFSREKVARGLIRKKKVV